MKANPVYKREIKVSARTSRMAITMLVFNGLLAGVALLNMHSLVEQAKFAAEIQYSSFLKLYIFVSALEFALILLIIPSITAGSISGERERQTLDLMLTTKMKPLDIILGKLYASFSTLFILIISSFPILALAFIYGGLKVVDLCMLLLFFYIAAALIGSMGLMFSALFKRSTMSSVVSYVGLLVLIVGGPAVNWFSYKLSEYSKEVYLGDAVNNSGGLLYLLLFNPAVTFWGLINSQAGNKQTFQEIFDMFGKRSSNLVLNHWVFISIVCQFLLAALFLFVASKAVNPMNIKPGKKEK